MEALLKAIHKAVFWVQTKAHGPQDLCVFLAQVVEGVHQLIQVRMGVHHVGCQDVVERVCGTGETLLHLLLPPDELGDLETQMFQNEFRMKPTNFSLASKCLPTFSYSLVVLYQSLI